MEFRTMQTKPVQPTAVAKNEKNQPKQAAKEAIGSDFLFKIAVPVVLAFIAAFLNANAVAKQMKTQGFLSYKDDLSFGHIVNENDLVEVKIGGQLGQIPYLKDAKTSRTQLIGRIVNRPIKKGELVVESQFGGISVTESSEYRSFELPRNLSRNLARSVRPGQWFTVRYALKNNTDTVYALGPFEVAPIDQNYRLDSSESVTVLNVKEDKDVDQQIFMLQEVLEGNSKYTSQCVPLSATAKEAQPSVDK
jgi:hypothetical protein